MVLLDPKKINVKVSAFVSITARLGGFPSKVTVPETVVPLACACGLDTKDTATNMPMTGAIIVALRFFKPLLHLSRL